MITDALLNILLLMVGSIFTIISSALSVLGVSLSGFVAELRTFSLSVFSVASYFYDPVVLKRAVLYIPALFTARITAYIVRYAINLIRGSGA